MIGTGTFVLLTESGISYIKEMYEDFQYKNEKFEVLSIDEDEGLYEVNINGHLFWMRIEEIVES